MTSSTYLQKREQLSEYFDRKAAAAWQVLTSNDPVSRIRATVRAGRDAMRQSLLKCLPADMRGMTMLDAGCGTGALAVDAARRGADVIAIDIAANLVDVARERAAAENLAGTIDFRVGDMLADAPPRVDYVVAMDSLIHYDAQDIRRVVTDFARRSERGVAFTAAPWTPVFGLMHAAGKLVPRREDRAPAIAPLRIPKLIRALSDDLGNAGWSIGQSQRIRSGFYISHALAFIRA